MVAYHLHFPHRHRQFIHFTAHFTAAEDQLHLQLPAWRPGRYELGNFAKNIRGWQVSDSEGRVLEYRKHSKDLWVVDTKDVDVVTLSYQFAANTLNAGSTWVDDEQVYVNPVNCFFYDANQQEQAYQIHLDLPLGTPVACQMKHKALVLEAPNTQALMDAPFMASTQLKHASYDVGNERYHLWMMGEVHFDVNRFIAEHKAFTEDMVRAFGNIPLEEYHFMYQFPRFAVRHGVEHSRSTVITMGPASKLAEESSYRELMGIACHELYHTWNIKCIRPADMLPYDFSKENYSELGYVCEGVTTWFGDEFLHRSGVFDDAEFFKRLATTIKRHLWNPGRFNLSVAESSWDTWLDGYVAGIPWRKVSIYNEGTLVTFILDALIREATKGVASMDTVMERLYNEFGLMGKGYTSADYRRLIEEVSGTDMSAVFDGLVFGTEDYMPSVRRALAIRGWYMRSGAGTDRLAATCGLKLVGDKVAAIWPDGPADAAGVWIGDQIQQTTWSDNGEQVSVTYLRHAREFHTRLRAGEGYFPEVEVGRVSAI